MAIGAVAVGLAAAAGLWFYGDRLIKNPLALPEHNAPYALPPGPSAQRQDSGRSHNKNRRVAYRADLDADPFHEAVAMLGDGDAVLYRRRRPVARFRPTPYQLAKIRSERVTSSFISIN